MHLRGPIARKVRASIRPLGLICVLMLTAPVALAEPEIRFVSPRHLSTVVGPTTIELDVRLPSGVSVRQIELRVDNRVLKVFSGPPYKIEWDAGDASRGHPIEARMTTSDGQEFRAVIRTSALRINQVEEVGWVNLYALVRDKSGAYVSDLQRDDFVVLENGVPQRITQFSTERKPLRVGIVLDTSLSMSHGKGTKLKNARSSALEFLEVLQPGDEGMVVTFNDAVEVAQDLTADKNLLARAITEADSRGGTALYDAIYRTARKLEDFDGRRVMVLLSDGRDEAYEGLEPGSLHTLSEALDQALRSEVMVFTIGLGRRLDQEYILRWERNLYGASNVDTNTSLGAILRRIAGATGGRALISVGAGQLRKAFRNVAEDLHHQYLLAYVSSDQAQDGKWREIEVKTRTKALEVITREGYYARLPADEASISGSANRDAGAAP